MKTKIQNSSLENNSLEPITHKIAKDLKIKVSEVEKISERLIKKDLLLDHSLNKNNNNDDDRTPMDFLNDTSLKPDEITLNNEIHGNRKRVIKKSLHALNDKEKALVNAFYTGAKNELASLRDELMRDVSPVDDELPKNHIVNHAEMRESS